MWPSAKPLRPTVTLTEVSSEPTDALAFALVFSSSDVTVADAEVSLVVAGSVAGSFAGFAFDVVVTDTLGVEVDVEAVTVVTLGAGSLRFAGGSAARCGSAGAGVLDSSGRGTATAGVAAELAAPVLEPRESLAVLVAPPEASGSSGAMLVRLVDGLTAPRWAGEG